MRWGLIDWWAQRISGIFLALFALPLLSNWYLGYLSDDYSWYQWLSQPEIKALTLLGLFGFAVHARIGMWVVMTDYLPRRWQEYAIQLLNIWILVLSIWGLYLIWVL